MLRGAWLAFWIAAMPAMNVSAADEFSFDLSQYGKKAYEFGGYLQGSAEHIEVDRDAALSALSFPDGAPDSYQRYRGVLELTGKYRWDSASLNALWHGETLDEYTGNRHNTRFYELYVDADPGERWTLLAGKRALRWGKGYAFNPVGFLERPKDATDPELSREGFVLASAEYVRSFDGPLQTVSFTPVIVPVSDDINDDFGSEKDTNLAARLYLLYRDTDIDILLRSGDSRADAFGVDFARNLTTNFEIHGELAWFDERTQSVLDAGNTLVTRETEAFDWLLGLRYLTAAETTWITEVYHNGAGYTRDEMQRFYDLARATPTTPALRPTALAARQAGYGTPQPMRDYLYIKVSQKEPFEALYWNAGATTIINLHDSSYTLIPEVSYSGITNLELRGRLSLLDGGRDTDFGERPNDWRAELRLRYFF
ncbi:hypothetical protein [Thiohalophilus sp.]|uniref:hypothetical protein n=1 Tax=Thiohalophilus sp. TaxID=3028392 RepID=UPI002ACDD4A7|nr:hypothetical protein [Thiohalophilus sp.]MDZ7802728.1 hypothetical protein [Thiohalophilus sp.]